MGENIKILVCAHKNSRLPQHEYFCPIQVGASLTSARFFPVLDNTGDNISDRNPHFCELTAHYWAWKNLKCDIIGLNHYRRFFDFHRPFPAFSPDRSFINIDSFLKETYQFPDLETLLNDYDIILSPKRHYPYNVATQYAISHLVNDLNLLKNAGTTERDGRNDAKRLCTNVVTVSDEVKPKKRKMQGKAEYSRRTVCKSLPKKM